MRNLGTRSQVDVRPYTDGDETETLALLKASLGDGPAGSRTREFFRWKHIDNPFGRSFMLVAESEGKIVGFRAFMSWQLEADGSRFRALRAVDTATHPDYRGRGVFARLTRDAVAALADEADVVFNTPNAASLPGYLKLGWSAVGRFGASVRVRRPVRFARRARSLRAAGAPSSRPPDVLAPTAAEILEGEESEVTRLLAEVPAVRGRLVTPRDPTYLRWRYGEAPGLDYRAVSVRERDGLRALAIFRVRARGSLWESSIAELLVGGGEAGPARTALRQVVHAARSDHVTCRFTRSGDEASVGLATGFVRSPVGATFVVNKLRDGVTPDPEIMRSWALALGDLEVF